MRLIVNSTAVEPESGDPHAWIIDSEANAYIMPFRNKLNNYHEFTNQVRVKGFAGKTELARGTGFLTLTDRTGKRITLKDVVYVPESPDQILSLIKLRRENNADFYRNRNLRDLISQWLFLGESVNDTLYIWMPPAIHVYALHLRLVSEPRICIQLPINSWCRTQNPATVS